MELNKRIRQLRRVKELSQKQVAKMCGVSHDTYRRWEFGTQEPRLTQLISLAVALDLDLKEVINGQSSDTGASSDAPTD